MAIVKVRLNSKEFSVLEKMAKEENVSASTMLAVILDRGDNHPSFLDRGDNHLDEEEATK